MTIFDLLFMLVVLGSLIALLAAVAAALRRRGPQALRILRGLGIVLACYLVVVAVTGLLAPQRVIAMNDPWCFDDWCLSVEHVSKTEQPSIAVYSISLRISSRARRVTQRAKGAWICLIDRQGHRYTPEPDPAAVPLDVALGPGESVSTSRLFKVPADASDLGLVTGHGGPGLFIIGDGSSLLHKPTYIRLQ